MSRYIDADKLQRHGNRGGVVYWRDIEAQPTADVIEVVRCKDCKHYKRNIPCVYGHYNGCELSGLMVELEHYCSYGERAE